MLNLRPEDILHKASMNRLLMEIIDNLELAQGLVFRGGTCAAMLGYLDRFSVDLDFDVHAGADEAVLRAAFYQVFDQLNLVVTKEINQALFFQIRYPSQPGQRNSMRISASNLTLHSNQFRPQYLSEIDRFAVCQTIETMFANKLVALMDRYRAHHTIAGRDVYDIHHFFVQGYAYHAPVITQRTGQSLADFFADLITFIQTHVTQTIINQDLNTLLPPDKFQQIRKILIPETLALLKREQEKMRL